MKAFDGPALPRVPITQDAAGALVLGYADTGQNRRPRRLQGVEGYTQQVDSPLQKPARPDLPEELVPYRADRSLLPAEGSGGPEQAFSKEWFV